MSITVEGVLPDPMGNPLGKATIRVVTIDSEFTPSGSEAATQTGKDGTYSFVLEAGTFYIDMNQDDEYTEASTVLIPESLTGSISLASLIATYKVQE